MEKYQQIFEEEKAYLHKALGFIKNELKREIQILSNRREELLNSRKEMWENTVHFSTDFERLTEISQYLAILNSHTTSYGSTFQQIEKYKKLLTAPYFGRFDFVESDSKEIEKIYVGMHNVIDPQSYEILVYDWRAPISNIFYAYELGDVAYRAPEGMIEGKVLLKRQYKIHKGELVYYFDCSVKIDDEILQQVLSHNASPKMKNIVKTIQKEQNVIIRDMDNELLIVQGVAGSGKTSIALHRIAYLLYHGMNLKLSSNNILIVSPNEIFNKYIAHVLPELGEENVTQITFDDLTEQLLGQKFKIEKRKHQLETLINCKDAEALEKEKRNMDFKGSRVFMEILNRWMQYYERKIISFKDVYYDGKVIETKHLLKNQFLNNKIGRPAAKRLRRMESMMLNKIHPLRKERLKKIEKLVQRMDGHELEVKSFSRLLSIKESKTLLKSMRSFTQIDFFEVYHLLFKEDRLFLKFAKDLMLPEEIAEIIKTTQENLEKGFIAYEDCGPLLYLKLKIEGNDIFSEIKQVVIDEAQDYTPIQYGVFKLLFKESRFTILGDIHQSIDKDVEVSLYDVIDEILDKSKSVHLHLNKSYRSTYEISRFSQKILNLPQDCVSFERYEEKPVVLVENSIEAMEDAIVKNIQTFTKEGYETIAVICKTIKEAHQLYHRMKEYLAIRLISSKEDEVETGVMILPAYVAKGLEFDAVIVYNTSSERYLNEIDKKLLYIACTRALHRLALYYVGEKSRFIPEPELYCSRR
ncbi:UvrD-helicase domain-containing protein [Clostridiaceae bacterium 35-E11]